MEKEVQELHLSLWTVMKDLLGSDSGTRGDDRAPEVLSEELRAVTSRITEFWGSKLTEESVKAAEAATTQKAEKEEAERRFREVYVESATDAFADELDALRSDAAFKGSAEDVQAMIQMLEDGMSCFNDDDTRSLWLSSGK